MTRGDSVGIGRKTMLAGQRPFKGNMMQSGRQEWGLSMLDVPRDLVKFGPCLEGEFSDETELFRLSRGRLQSIPVP